MLARLATFTVRRRRAILVTTLVVFLAAAVYGGNVATRLSSGGFDNPSSDSSQARHLLDERFHTGSPNLVLLVDAGSATVDAPQVAAAGRALTSRLAGEADVADVTSYWSLGGAAPLRSKDAHKALVVARITGTDKQVSERIKRIQPRYAGSFEGLPVRVGGVAEVFRQVGTTTEHDLQVAEMIALPITLLLLLFIFRGLVAALLPLVIGAISIVGTFTVLKVMTELTNVSVFALNLTTALGLGLAIDYSLFVLSRFREERAAGFGPDIAVQRTVRAAGRTVAFSAFTVAVSLSVLLVFPTAFLRSFAYAGVAVGIIAGLASVVVLPAVLGGLGDKVDALSVRRHAPKPAEEGVWHRIALFVMRRPIPVAAAAVVLLVVLGSPFTRIALGQSDDRVLPTTASSRQVSDVLRTQFATSETNALPVVAASTASAGTGAAELAAIDHYATELSTIDGVARVDARTGIYTDGKKVLGPGPATQRFGGAGATWLSVVPSVEPESAAGEQLVHDLRSASAPFTVKVGGAAAERVDTNDAIYSRLPLALAIIAATTFVLLFLMFGSVVVPIKALVLNVLSLTATFGAMVWIFQEGHLSNLLGFTPTGTIDAGTPILMFCIAFGLSMDYEVFLLSRIKEEHDAGRSNVDAVALGLERTGRIVTAAALLIAVVFIAFATSQVAFLKLFGVGLALAVLMDAFVIRGTLVPAFMRLAGDANWWAPAPLRRLHARIGISEHVDLDDLDDRGAGSPTSTPDRGDDGGVNLAAGAEDHLEPEPMAVR
jgi:RND superfamily putative drug exporter